MKTVRNFEPDGVRYSFDCGSCSYANGWAQIDTSNDASYYGNWTNPSTLQIASYCEGDVTLETAETEEEYVAAIRAKVEWHKGNDSWLGIDPGWPESDTCKTLTERFTSLGLADLLH